MSSPASPWTFDALAEVDWPAVEPPVAAGLRAFLQASSDLAALVSDRVHALRLPEKQVLPAIVVWRVSDVRDMHLRGPQGMALARYQLDAWAKTPDVTREIATRLRLLLAGYAGIWTDASVSPARRVRVTIAPTLEMESFAEHIFGGLARTSSDALIWHQALS